jgi:hypothetical protein
VPGPLDGFPAGLVTAELANWVAASPRFRAFVEANGPKIRKKLRGAADPEALLDVRAELRVAALLLAERRLGLAFEAYGARGGPDFTVTFRAARPFNLEVTRVRRPLTDVDLALPILAKLRQLPPSVPNVLVVALPADSTHPPDVEGAVRALRARADRKDEAFFAGRGFASSRAFYERFLRLGGVVAWREAAVRTDRASSWLNRSARIALPARAAEAIAALLQGT